MWSTKMNVMIMLLKGLRNPELIEFDEEKGDFHIDGAIFGVNALNRYVAFNNALSVTGRGLRLLDAERYGAWSDHSDKVVRGGFMPQEAYETYMNHVLEIRDSGMAQGRDWFPENLLKARLSRYGNDKSVNFRRYKRR